ncbi:MAG: hypothetical protein ABR884_02115 [Minisyncoccia bacterium]|jgi:hypothetical protein
MDSSSSFEHVLEADMKTLAAEIHRTQEMKDAKNAEGLDAVKEAIRAFPQLGHGAAEDNGVPVPATDAQAFSNSPLPAYAQNAAPEIRLEIEYLLDIALHKGISAALSESAKSPYFVQDAFHDALAGRLYPELQKRGLMK